MGGGVSGDGWWVQWMVMVEVQVVVMVGGGCSGWVEVSVVMVGRWRV